MNERRSPELVFDTPFGEREQFEAKAARNALQVVPSRELRDIVACRLG